MRYLTATIYALLAGLLLVGPAVWADEKVPDKTTSPEATEIGGTVKLKGEPLPAGLITFHGRDARDTVRVFIDNGKYLAKNPPGGEIRVTIDTEGVRQLAEQFKTRLKQLESRAELMKKAKAEEAELEKVAKQIKEMKDRVKILDAMQAKLKGVKLDPQYSAPDMTPLMVALKPGKQTYDIDLK